jgi:signal peptidase I
VPKSHLREWIDALVFAVIVMLIVRTLLFDLFRIPTPSMEKNLLVGDYLFVSKLNYGTRTPRTLGIPFTDIYVPGLTLPNTRLPGFGEVERGDAVVFNWPADLGKPVDRREHYIKRVIGLPGDTIAVTRNVVSINSEPLPLATGMQQMWFVEKTGPRVRLPSSALLELGVSELSQTANPAVVRISATTSAAEEIATWSYVQAVRPALHESDPVTDSMMYVKGRGWTPHDFGPLPIPARDQTVTLTMENWPYYETVIARYEGHTAEALPDSTFRIDGQAAETYTFAQDYFFMMGDNRDNSEDSRFWGYVPMDHIVGKAIFIYFSWDAERTLPRFGRLFSGVR